MHHDILTPAEDATLGSPSADTTGRCKLDQRIRALGYEIARRPRKGQPVWVKGGVEFTQREVVQRERL